VGQAATKLKWAKRRWFIVRLAVSAALLLWLAVSVDWSATAHALLGASPRFVALTCGLYYVGVALSAWKWGLLLRIEGASVGFRQRFSWYLFGAFASNFLPTDIGGDLGRGALAARVTGKPVAVARSILVERLSGLLFLLLLAWIGGLVLPTLQAPTLVVSALAPLAAFALWVLWRALRRSLWLSRFQIALETRLPRSLSELFAAFGPGVRHYRDYPAVLLGVALLSFVFQILAGVGLWLNFRAVGVELPLTAMILAMALSSAVGLLPISINGWGVREALLLALLVPLGATPAGVLAGAFFTRAAVFALSLVGAAPLLLQSLRAQQLVPPTAAFTIAELDPDEARHVA